MTVGVGHELTDIRWCTYCHYHKPNHCLVFLLPRQNSWTSSRLQREGCHSYRAVTTVLLNSRTALWPVGLQFILSKQQRQKCRDIVRVKVASHSICYPMATLTACVARHAPVNRWQITNQRGYYVQGFARRPLDRARRRPGPAHTSLFLSFCNETDNALNAKTSWDRRKIIALLFLS